MRHISGGEEFRPRGGLLPILGERKSGDAELYGDATDQCTRQSTDGLGFGVLGL